jgi:beta-lactamase class D
MKGPKTGWRKIVKNIMIEEETPAYTLRAKTGMAEWDGDGTQRGKALGWYVGYVTKENDVFFFATCIQSAQPDDRFAATRKQITRRILANLRILPLQVK